MQPSQTITIPGQPVAMGRPRFAAGGRTYLPKKTREALNFARAFMLIAKPIEGPVALDIVFVMKRPKSMMGKKYRADRIFHSKRPDLDNMVKLVADSLQPRVLNDDAQIVMLTASKWYAAKDEEPKTKILIRSIEQL